MTRMSIPVVDCPDDATLARLRTDFYSPPFPKNEAPPFRVQVARRPNGDLVQINTAHAAVDGIGMLRLLRSITDAYRGKVEAPPPLPLEEARDLVMAAIEDRPFDVTAAVGRLTLLAQRHILDPSTACIVAAAEARATHGEICAVLRRELGFGQPLAIV